MNNNINRMPIIPLCGLVVFPYMILTFTMNEIANHIEVKDIYRVFENDARVFFVTQKDTQTDKPTVGDLCVVGTVARVKQIVNVPGYPAKILFEGLQRGALREIAAAGPYLNGAVEVYDEQYIPESPLKDAYLMRLKNALERCYVLNDPNVRMKEIARMKAMNSLDMLCDTIAGTMNLKLEAKQKLLFELDVYKRAEELSFELEKHRLALEIDLRIAGKVQERMDKNQREYYMREKLRVIQEELGDGVADEAEEYEEKINALNAKTEIKEKLLKEVERFKTLPPSQAESAVVRTYLDTVLEMPWNNTTEEKFEIKEAQTILEEDHYGLEKVKERVLEYLAVRAMTNGKSSAILCLVGPPGVGKTSVAKSIARALGRKYVRVSLGGIHDEADIRGHRKTYIGAMEGRIMAAMKEAKTKNPVMLLDEIDKMGIDYKGDPSAALLEVLDYEQNGEFRDHYLEVPFDLSQVIFITTANTLDTVSRPLLDRMEVIELSGYTDAEKLQIAQKYLMKKALEKNGMTAKQVIITESAIKEIIDYHTREAGVRKLEQQLEALCRKAAKKLLESGKSYVRITDRNIESYLGKRRYHFEKMNKTDQIGIARGLAWTSVGGETLSIEVNVMKGTGKVKLTGQLGDVMQESAAAALSYIRSHSDELKIDSDFYERNDIHIHVPEGAVPKDGPSAGITMATALASAFTERPVKNDIAMTGEITLRGRVLPIGGLKEKSMAAYRAGIKTVIIPEENKPDIDDIPREIRDNMKFIPVSSMDTVLKNALR